MCDNFLVLIRPASRWDRKGGMAHGVGERKIRKAIDKLDIEPTTFKIDRRVKYYSPEDIKRIQEWLLSQ